MINVYLFILTSSFHIYRHAEHVAELFFLQSNGNMMEYPSWRKKPPVPPFIAFKKSYRLDPTADDNESIRVSSLFCDLSFIKIFMLCDQVA
jgi:hypothetical protein